MTILLFLAVSCSKQSDKPASKISAPIAPAVSNSAPTTLATVIPEAPKNVKKHRPANATYVNGTYGVSFSYPRKYSLQSGDKNSSAPVQANFLKPGAVQIASVDMPDSSYPNTDFSSALLNVSVNQGVTSEECGQFVPDSKNAETAKPTTVRLGMNEFTELERMNGEGNSQSDLKYFHLFKNGACYEFALAVETSRKPDQELTQVDRGKIFRQLEKILTTARIKGIVPPVEENAQKPAGPEIQETPNSSAQAQVVAPAKQ